MSIVITVLDPRDQTISMMADKRSTTKDRETGEIIKIENNTEKILQLTEKIYLGITGDLKCCLDLYRALTQHNSANASSILEYCQTWAINKDCCSFIVTGIYDDGQLFAFYRTMQRNFDLILLGNGIRYVILTHKINFNDFFEQRFVASQSARAAMEDTVKYAATLDDSISVESAFVKISC
jgi:hypothetical protein